jgi:ketosteroid isomerase-like protein
MLHHQGGDVSAVDRGPSSEAGRVALAFVERINAGDVAGIVALMTDDHEFVDTSGAAFRGREGMHDGWVAYFRLFPDYQIAVDRVLVEGPDVTLLGRSSGTLSAFGLEALRRPDGSLPPDHELQGPAIWTACVRDGLVCQWRVYADTPDTRALLGTAE